MPHAVFVDAGGGQADEGLAALAHRRAGEEVHLPAGAGDVPEAGALAAYLAVEVDGDAAVQGDEIIHARNHLRVVHVGYGQGDDARVLVQPVVELARAGGEAEDALAGEDGLALVGELAGLVEVEEAVGAELGVHAQVLEVALRQDGAQGVGRAAYAELERRAVDDVGQDVVGDGDVLRRGRLVPDGGHLVRVPLDYHVDVGDMDALVISAVDLGQVRVNLQNYLVRAAYHVQTRARGDGEVEVAVPVHGRGADEGDVDVQELPVIPGEVAEYHRREVREALVHELAVVARGVPAVICEMLARGVALYDLDGAVHYLRADIDVKELVAPLGEGGVAEGGKGRAVAVLNPVAAFDKGRRLLGRAQLALVLSDKVHVSSSVYICLQRHYRTLPQLWQALKKVLYFAGFGDITG